jgi:endonuclease III
MSITNRTALLNKLQRVLKKTYKPVSSRGDHPLLETLLFACCLENAHHDIAHDALQKLRESFFDWNEIRVSTVKELAESLSTLPDSMAAAARLKSVLQAVFESDYSFDLEHLKKQNLGSAVKRLQKLPGASAFGVAYTTQVALGGHAIPLDKGTLDALVIIGLATEAEAANCNITGLERAIPKSKGQEFGSLVHELGADLFASPFSLTVRELLLSIAPDAKERFPKRGSKKAAAKASEPEEAPAKASKKKSKEVVGRKSAGKASAGKAPAIKGAARASKAAPSQKKVAARTKKAPAKTLSKRKPR